MTGGGVEATPALPRATTWAVSRLRGRAFADAAAQKIAEICLLGILGLVPLTFSFATDEVFAIPKVTLLWSLTLVVVAAFVSLVVIRGHLQLLDKRVSLPVVAYLLVMGVATIFSVSPTFSWYGNHARSDGLITIASYIILFFAASTIAYSLKQARNALIVAVVAAAIVSILGVYQFFGGAPFGLDPSAFDFRPFSTIGNPDFLGTYAVLLFPVSIGLFLSTESRVCRVSYAIAALVIATCLVFTLSRGAWLAFALSFVSLLVMLRGELQHRWAWFASGAGILVVAIILLQAGWFVPVRQLVAAGTGPTMSNKETEALRGDTALNRALGTFEARDAGIRSRLGYWQGALAIIEDRPLIGGGPNTFAQTFGKFAPVQYARAEGLDRFPDKVHNEFLEAGVAGGIPGLLTYVAAILSLGLLFWRTRGRYAGTGAILRSSLFATWLAYVVNTTFIFPTIDTGSVFWVLMGISVGTFLPHEVKDVRLNIGRPAGILVHIGLIVLLVVGFQFAVKPYLADVHFKAARNGHDGSEVQIANLREAIRLNPNDVYYYSQYAWLLGWKALQTDDLAARRKLLDESASILGEAIQKDPRNHQLYHQRGQLYSQYNNDHALDALADFQRATALYPNYYNAYLSTAHFARTIGRFDAAIAADNRMLRIFPHDETAFQGLSFDLFAAGRYDEAAGVLQKALKFDPENAELYYRLGKTYEAMSDLENAEESYVQALALKPDHTLAASALESLRKNRGNDQSRGGEEKRLDRGQ